MKIGLDIGSTTLKCVVLDDKNEIVFKSYERHYSKPNQALSKMLDKISNHISQNTPCSVAISGSAGMGLADNIGTDFIQEVYATKIAAETYLNDSDIIIELGGEDAKILFLKGGLEARMNGSCAGGTGAFIDQMATLLNFTPHELNSLATEHTKIYSIASRCGVFAKSDIQPLLNQGASKSDICASILHSVVNQTVAGLAQGREIEGNVVYLGGPLTFLSQLRQSFDEILGITGICPENSLYYVALGAAMCANCKLTLDDIKKALDNKAHTSTYLSANPLFNSEQDYKDFTARHSTADIEKNDDKSYSGNAFIGVDAGSTTVKIVIIDENGKILFTHYEESGGNPVGFVKGYLEDFYRLYPNAKVASSAATGYGEELIKNAFSLDIGIVETLAHFTAAKSFCKSVDFIIDIGGQDIKCFKVVNGAIDDIFLNEACSSGCGSFLQSFAAVLGYTPEQFAKLGLFAEAPVDLGTRCTVFMNSSVKQAQKDGATVDNISAGLCVGVVKNALYKVIRAVNASTLGEKIVVQGGTFLNDAVLRAFEQEIGHDVIRPQIAGLMGAYGAALFAKEHAPTFSTALNLHKLSSFSHNAQSVNCNLCNNHCALTVNTFDGERKFIGGNRCERPVANENMINTLNLYKFKRDLLRKYKNSDFLGKRGKIGIPLGLYNYELLPFWSKFFEALDFSVSVSSFSTKKLYLKGQHTIPSDTVCFPAKLMHGHIEELVENGCETIFYPCMTYNLDEGLGDNHYNCPVVAYYPEVVKANVPAIKNVKFICDYIGIHRPKDFALKIHKILSKHFTEITLNEIKTAVKLAFKENQGYLKSIRDEGQKIIEKARKKNMQIIILAGRPYHLDPEINHGIDKLICACGAAIITEDAVSHLIKPFSVDVLNQWTYHSRLYAAAKYTSLHSDINLVQLVSFGCGVDAITTDEVRAILAKTSKICTQIKIDEITNLCAVKIRLRSLFSAISQKDGR